MAALWLLADAAAVVAIYLLAVVVAFAVSSWRHK